MRGAVEVARRTGIPLVATSDVHYVNREDAGAQDILLCVNTGKFRTDTKRMKMGSDEFFLRSPEEMYAAFPGMEEAVRRSQEIADRVDIDLELGQRHFPVYSPPDGKTPEAVPRASSASRASRTATATTRSAARVASCRPRSLPGSDRELDVINKLGFPNYFLIVWDFVRFARQQGIEATARGSGVGLAGLPTRST